MTHATDEPPEAAFELSHAMRSLTMVCRVGDEREREGGCTRATAAELLRTRIHTELYRDQQRTASP
jgi:hypothetical protein